MARVLVIDDEVGVRATVRKFLVVAEHEVFEAADGISAFEILAGPKPIDLIVSDVYMTGMDGMEFTTRLQQLPRKPILVVISGGGHMGVADVLVHAAHLGAAATLAKPFTRDELLRVVADLLAVHGPAAPGSSLV